MSTETIAQGRYRVERPLGNGAMANVVLAHDEARVGLSRSSWTSSLRPPATSARASRARAAAAGLSHPNIVTVFDAGEVGGRPYIVMEYVDGATLEERLRSQGKVDPDGARSRSRSQPVSSTTRTASSTAISSRAT